MEALAAAIVIVVAIGYVIVRAIVFAQALRTVRRGRRAEMGEVPEGSPPAGPADEQGEHSAEDGPLHT